MNHQIISVSEFINILNETLVFAYPEVVIEGEVSSFKVNQGKWVFFDLKDEQGTLPCFMPLFSLKLPIEDGMKIRVTASPKLTNWGKFSLTVRSIQLAGEGELKRAMALLKSKLEKEGLFDPSRKRPLPRFPEKIGLITSGTSAAYADFIKVLDTRWSGLSILLADIQVQGVSAPDQILNALEYFNSGRQQVDVVVLIRGGGSLEDLQAFSTEPVARAVAASRTPIIVGVGHETDISLADYAADVRAATPTDAARLVVPDKNELYRHLVTVQLRLKQSIARQTRQVEQDLVRNLSTIERSLRKPRQQLEVQTTHIIDTFARHLERHKAHVMQTERLIRGHSPSALLNRGYAIVRKDGAILKSPAGLSGHDELMIQLAKGELRVHPSKKI
jgi:exodeoxyribonuclease VII large subunit